MSTAVFSFKFDSSGALSSMKQLQVAAGRTEQAVGGLDGRAGKLRSQFNSLAGPVAKLGAVLASAFSIKGIIEVADSMTLLKARLDLASGSAEAGAAALAQLNTIANANATSIDAVATLYTRLANSMGETGASSEQMLGITESLSAALRISGASAAESSSVMLQFSQAMGSGVLRGEEFNAIFENAPIVMKAVAQSMTEAGDQGVVTTGMLREMAAAGELTSDVVGNALLNSLEDFRAKSAELPPTVGGAFQVLKNEFSLLVAEINSGEGSFTTVIAGWITALTGWITTFKGYVANWGAWWDVITMTVTLGAEQIVAMWNHGIDTLKNKAMLGLTNVELLFRETLATLEESVVIAFSNIGGTIGKKLEFAATALGIFGAAQKALGLDELSAKTLNASLAIAKLTDSIDTNTEYTSKLREGTFDLKMVTHALTDRQEELDKQFKNTIRSTDDQYVSLLNQAQAATKLSNETTNNITDITALGGAMDNANDSTKGMSGSTKKLAQDTNDAAQAFEDANAHVTAYEANVASMADKTTEKYHDFQKDVETTNTELVNGIAGVFDSFLTSGEDAFSGIIDSFKRMLSQLIATAIANPIQMLITPVMIGGGGGAMAAETPTMFDPMNLFNSGGGTSSLIGGGGFLSGIAGSGLYGLGGLIGGGFGGGLAATGSLISSNGFIGAISPMISNVASWAAGGSAMAALGAVAPYLVAIAAIASAFGLFGKEKTSKGVVQGAFNPDDFDATVLQDKNAKVAPLLEALNNIGKAADAAANVLGVDLSGVTIRIESDDDNITAGVYSDGKDFVEKLNGDEITEDLWAQMTLAALRQGDMSEVNSVMTAFLENLDEHEIKGLESDEIEDMLKWMVEMNDAAAIAAETFEGIALLIESFEGAPTAMQEYATNLIAIGVAMNESPMTVYSNAVAEANKSITSSAFAAGRELAVLINQYDGSAEATAELAAATLSYKNLAVAAAAAISQAMEAVDAIIGSAIEGITLQLMTEDQQIKYLLDQAKELQASLASMDDPAQIASTVAQISELVAQAFQLMTPEQQQEMGQTLIDFLAETGDIANGILEGLGTTLEAQFEMLNGKMDFSLLEAASEQMNGAATRQQVAARSMNVAASRMESAASRIEQAGATLNSAANAMPRSIEIDVNGGGAQGDVGGGAYPAPVPTSNWPGFGA